MSKKQTIPPCPYCADPDFFRKALFSTSMQRGKFTIRTTTDKELASRYAGFQIVVIGRQLDYVPPSPPGKFFHKNIAVTFGGAEAEISCQIFDGCRVTKKGSAITVDVHWWPDHGLKLIPSGLDSAQDFDVLNQIVKLFRPETRGASKITEENVSTAIQSFGKDATQSSLAKELGVSRKGLQQWAARNGMETWEKMKKRYQTSTTAHLAR